MEPDRQLGEVLRCADCHALYGRKPDCAADGAATCPECGSQAWLAAQIPVASQVEPSS
jgi:DNA-directed RNA polymerase subunit RPC12/RpoP